MNKTRILLVDDHAPLARLVGSRLEQTGFYQVRVETVPHVAAQAARDFQADLWLFDVNMPGMTGPELALTLRREAALARTPAIFLTSLVTKEEAGTREIISQGNRYLAKTAPLEVLHSCITRAIQAAAAPAR